MNKDDKRKNLAPNLVYEYDVDNINTNNNNNDIQQHGKRRSSNTQTNMINSIKSQPKKINDNLSIAQFSGRYDDLSNQYDNESEASDIVENIDDIRLSQRRNFEPKDLISVNNIKKPPPLNRKEISADDKKLVTESKKKKEENEIQESNNPEIEAKDFKNRVLDNFEKEDKLPNFQNKSKTQNDGYGYFNGNLAENSPLPNHYGSNNFYGNPNSNYTKEQHGKFQGSRTITRKKDNFLASDTPYNMRGSHDFDIMKQNDVSVEYKSNDKENLSEKIETERSIVSERITENHDQQQYYDDNQKANKEYNIDTTKQEYPEEAEEHSNNSNSNTKPIPIKPLNGHHVSPKYFHQMNCKKTIAEKSFNYLSSRMTTIDNSIYFFCSENKYNDTDPSPKKPVNGSNTTVNSLTIRDFYYQILVELEKIFSENSETLVERVIHSSDITIQKTCKVLDAKFGKRYTHGLFLIFQKYTCDHGSKKNIMTLYKLNAFLKDFKLLNDNLTLEQVTVFHAKRCPEKFIDFAAFIDILYKISGLYDITLDFVDKSLKYQLFLDEYILSKSDQIIQTDPKTQKITLNNNINIFDNLSALPENEALRLLEGHDELFKHLFSLYHKFDLKLSNSSILLLKDFNKFCTEFCICPALCNLSDILSIFRRFEINNQNFVDFKGFIMIICYISQIGYQNTKSEKKQAFSKKLKRCLQMLQDLNSRLADEILESKMKTMKGF